MFKRCTCCKDLKSFDLFYNNRSNKNGKHDQCKSCMSNFQKKKKRKLREIKEKEKQEEVSKKTKKVCSRCKEEKIFSEFYKHKRTSDGFACYCKICSKIVKNKNPEKVKETKRKNYIKNKDKIKKRSNEYRNNRLKTDPSFKLLNSLRHRVRQVLRRGNKKKHKTTKELLGCDKNELKLYLEKQFQDGMTWENFGSGSKENPRTEYWVIDHILPCASFNLSDVEEQKKCFHYTNLQPLWWWENLEKRDKIEEKYNNVV